MTVIELGNVTAGDPAVPSPDTQTVDRRTLRRLRAALVAVVCLAVVTGSAPTAEPRGLRTLWSLDNITGNNFPVIGDLVFLLGEGSRQTLSAYGVRDGKVRWSRELPDRVEYLSTEVRSGLLLLPTNLKEPAADDGSRAFFTETVALDAATGAERWRIPGDIALTTAGDLLVSDHSPDGRSIARLRLVRLADGVTRWTRETPGTQLWTPLGPDPVHPDRLATVTSAGRARVLRWADGTDVASGAIDWPGDSWPDGQFTQLLGRNDSLYTIRMTRDEATVTAYAADTLARRWRISKASDGGASGCGPVLCIAGAAELVGYDWATGAVRWRLAGHDNANPIGQDLLVADGTAGTGHRLIDGRTGRVIADLAGALPTWDDADGLIVTVGPTRNLPRGTAVTRVDPRTGEQFLLGMIEPVAEYGCSRYRKLLVCATLANRLTVIAVG
jgi:outer membrane protein assembly factor BamB